MNRLTIPESIANIKCCSGIFFFKVQIPTEESKVHSGGNKKI